MSLDAFYLFALTLLAAPQNAEKSEKVVPAVNAGGSLAADSNTKSATQQRLEDAPIDFRCDAMQIYTKPNRNTCQGHVVIRRGELLVCCDNFEGVADPSWAWQSFLCHGDVRAQRGMETVWSDRAEFFAADSDLVLTGNPILQRGDTVLEGERVVIDLKEDRARIARPRGHVPAERTPAPANTRGGPWTGSLPKTCPLPAIRR